jgi:hypothetical protein
MRVAPPVLGLLLVIVALATIAVVDGRLHSFKRHNVKIESLMAAKRNFPQKQINPKVEASAADLFTVIPGRYPKTVSLPDVLSNIPDGPEGRKFLQDLTNEIFLRTGIWIPELVLDLFFEDSSALLNYLQFTATELYDGIFALNWAYQNGYISNDAPTSPKLPNGFDLAQSQNFPLNLTNFIPGPPVKVAPGLWKGFYPGNASDATIKSEIIFGMALNQLANNSHLPNNDPKMFSVKYNGKLFSSVDDLLNALLANGHTVRCWLTWRAVDFFGYLTKGPKGEWLEVPAPIMMDTGILANYSNAGKFNWPPSQAILPAIHDELVIEIRSGPSSQGTTVNVDLLWYEGDDGIGFFARDLYSLASWVGQVDAEPLEGTEAVNYLHLAAVFTDVLLQTADKYNLYDLGYGATGVCVDSIAIIEYVYFNEMTLYPLLMEKYLVIPVVQQFLNVNNRNAQHYTALLKALKYLPVDVWDNPTLKTRVNNTITWPPGKEPFECVIQARAILQQ